MAKYVIQEMRNLHKEGETLLYPRMVIDCCCDKDIFLLKAHSYYYLTILPVGGIKSIKYLCMKGCAYR